MIFVIDNKDFRMKYIVRELRKKYEVKLLDEVIPYEHKDSILVLPIQGIDKSGIIKKTDFSLDEIISTLNPKVLVVPKNNPEYMKYGIHVIEYLTEDVEIENSFYTLEGTLALLIANTNNSIKENSILVTGYGKLGQTISKYLDILGAKVTVYSKYRLDLLHSRIAGYKVIDKIDKINYNVVINTIPAVIFTEEVLKQSKIGYYLELASPPYGIDMKYAKNKINTTIGSGLPGKFTPRSAGRLIGKKILELLND
ncbi:hypothetical protein RJG79_06105 [Mycoplasmatota bacterium WC44]